MACWWLLRFEYQSDEEMGWGQRGWGWLGPEGARLEEPGTCLHLAHLWKRATQNTGDTVPLILCMEQLATSPDKMKGNSPTERVVEGDSSWSAIVSTSYFNSVWDISGRQAHRMRASGGWVATRPLLSIKSQKLPGPLNVLSLMANTLSHNGFLCLCMPHFTSS